jgi:DNA-directed RNA polymerase subunit RPC12/RpoP
MQSRSKNSYETLIYDFLQYDILVACPTCSKKAIIKTGNFAFKNIVESEIKVICTNCGYNKRFTEKPSSVLYTSKYKTVKGRYYLLGGPIDPFFYLQLWLKTDFEGHTLWAYNFQHLTFLRSHIEATLRERKREEFSNKSIGSRLPKWMTSKKNREPVLKKIFELENK